MLVNLKSGSPKYLAKLRRFYAIHLKELTLFEYSLKIVDIMDDDHDFSSSCGPDSCQAWELSCGDFAVLRIMAANVVLGPRKHSESEWVMATLLPVVEVVVSCKRCSRRICRSFESAAQISPFFHVRTI
jgi:hypothetical protein